MASFVARVIQTNSDTNGGVVSYTSAGMGTPVAALIFAGRTFTAGSTRAGWANSWGITDGTTQLCAYVNSRDNVATGVSKAAGTNASLVRMTTPATNVVEAEAVFSAFITDGIQLNWTTASPLGSSFPVTIILFSGSGCQAYVTSATPPATTGATTVTPGFAADIVLTHTLASTNNTQLNQADHGPGFAFKNAGTPVSYGMQFLCDRGTTSQARSVLFNTDLAESITVGSSDTVTGISRINNYTSTTFDLVNSNSLQGPMLAMLALKVGGASVAVHEDVCPTSTGNQAYTWPGFRTGFLYTIFSNSTAVGTANDAAGGVGASDMETPHSGCASVYGLSGASTSKTTALGSTVLIDCYDANRVQQYKADVVSVNSNGHTLNFSVAPASGRKFFSLSIQEMAIPATGSSAGATAVSGTLLGAGALTGSAAGATGVSGTLLGAGALTGSAAGATAAAGTLLGAGALTGSSAGATAATGTLLGAGALTGSAAGATGISGTLLGSGALAGTSAGATAATGTLLGAGALVGSAAGATVVSGALGGAGLLAGTSAGATAVSGTLLGAGQLAATAAGATAASGTLLGAGALTGEADGATSAAGTLLGAGPLTGTSSGSTAASGMLSAQEFLTGSAVGATVVTGTLAGVGSLFGSAAGGTLVLAVLRGDGSLAGFSAGSTLVHGSIAVPSPACPLQLAGGAHARTDLSGGAHARSDLSAGYNAVVGLKGTTC